MDVITSLKCSWIKSLTIVLINNGWTYFLTVNRHDILQKIFDFGDRFILECLIKKTNAFWKDVLLSWTCYMKTITSLTNIAIKFFLFRYCQIPI